MTLGETLYELATRAVRPALRIAAPFDGKLRRGMIGRAAALDSLAAWARARRDLDRPLCWLHAPSVGEALMTQAIIAALRALRPDAQIAFTFFSPSAERVADHVGADVATYLPWDTRANARFVAAALKPAVLGFVRTEIWPSHLRATAAAGARAALVNAVLAADSSRLRAPARRLLATAYARLDAVGAVSDDDAARFPRLGVPPARVRVTGDARFDQVHARVQRIERGSAPLLAIGDGARVLVAGSTWPADEALLVPVFAALRARHADLRLVIAPHEPTAAHVSGIERVLNAVDLPYVRFTSVEAGAKAAAAVIVDRVGVLADLYAVATAAYVGGGFGRSGLHSVVEPAALAVPVAFGPAVGNAREAIALDEAGGGRIARTADALLDTFADWLEGGPALANARAAADAFVRARLGGAARNAALLAGLLD